MFRCAKALQFLCVFTQELQHLVLFSSNLLPCCVILFSYYNLASNPVQTTLLQIVLFVVANATSLCSSVFSSTQARKHIFILQSLGLPFARAHMSLTTYLEFATKNSWKVLDQLCLSVFFTSDSSLYRH